MYIHGLELPDALGPEAAGAYSSYGGVVACSVSVKKHRVTASSLA